MTASKHDADLQRTAELMGDVVEQIFAALRAGAAEAAQLWSRVSDEHGTVATSELAQLRPLIEARLTEHPYLDGAGLVVSPGALRDAARYQEWWRPSAQGHYEFLDVNTGFGEEPYDYTSMSWFAGATHGVETVRGPYVDLAGSDRYVLTFAVPAHHGEQFIGASGADITVASFESLAITELSALDSEVVVVNSADRIVVSNSADHSPGERMRACANTDTPIGGPGVNWRVHRV